MRAMHEDRSALSVRRRRCMPLPAWALVLPALTACPGLPHHAFDTPTLEPTGTVTVRGGDREHDWVSQVEVSPDGRWLLARCTSGQVDLWQARSGRPTAEPALSLDSGWRHSALTPTWDRGVSFAADGVSAYLEVWDLDLEGGRASVVGRGLLSNAYPMDVEITPDGRWALTLAHDVTPDPVASAPRDAYLVQLWQLSPSPRVVSEHAFEGSVNAELAMSADGRWAATLSPGTPTRLWRLEDRAGGRLVDAGRLPSPYESCQTIAFSPLGTHALTGSFGVLSLWELAGEGGPQLLARVDGGGTGVRSTAAIAFAPDGTAALSADGSEARLWTIAPGTSTPLTLAERLVGHGGRVLAVGLSPDGQRALTGGSDGVVQQWTLAEGGARPRATLEGHEHHVRTVAFGPGGVWAVTGSTDGTVRAWTLGH